MANRLEPIDLVSFVGGLNLRRNQFQLADDESPDLLNVDVDPRGGFYTRQGWARWNPSDVVTVATATTWQPRNAFVHDTSTPGTQYVYVVNGPEVYIGDGAGAFTNLSTLPDATGDPHRVDFSAWGDDVYMALGAATGVWRQNLVAAPAAMDVDDWSEIDAPNTGTFPSSTYIEDHGGYMWCADTLETGIRRRNRVRWSHPGVPDAWRQDDFLDIDQGGGYITGLMSFNDHLVVFKTTGIWAIYGDANLGTQQINNPSEHIGANALTGITKSSQAVFFHSTFEGGGIFAYTGGQPVLISEALRPAFEAMHAPHNVFVSWAGRRLWVAVPWHKDQGEKPDPTTLFVYDADVGNGSWTMYRSEYGAVATVLDGSDTEGRYPLAAFWSPSTAALVTLDFNLEAYDALLLNQTIGVTPGTDPLDPPDYLVTGGDDEVIVGGGTFQGQEFASYYRTRWLHAGWPDRKKSWRRPTFICREVPQDTDLLVEVYRDYDEANIARSRTLHLRSGGGSYWSDTGFDSVDVPGFDWTELGGADPSGRGADWGQAASGSRLIRGGSMGAAKAVQMKIQASGVSPRKKWGVDAIVAKIVMRRFR
jgi:hypothetical protein